MLTEKDYCDYELIVELEQLGAPIKIDFACGIENGQLVKTKFYPNPPSLYDAQKWLREEKKIGVFVSGFKNGYTFWVYNLLNGETLYQGFFDNQTGEKYKSYEEALSEGIKEAVKNLSIC